MKNQVKKLSSFQLITNVGVADAPEGFKDYIEKLKSKFLSDLLEKRGYELQDGYAFEISPNINPNNFGELRFSAWVIKKGHKSSPLDYRYLKYEEINLQHPD